MDQARYRRRDIDLRTRKDHGYVGNPELIDEEGNTVITAGGGEYNPLGWAETLEEQVANGHLIDSAPDLLAACEAFLTAVEIAERMAALTQMRAAVEKARR
jgi:hypothetical protein